MAIPSTNEIYWGAGLLDGEGCFTLNGGKGTYRITPMIGLSMTDLDTVERFQQIFTPSNTIYCRATSHKLIYQLRVVGKRAVGLMYMFFPLLSKRRRTRIKEVLSVWSSRKARLPRNGKDVDIE